MNHALKRIAGWIRRACGRPTPRPSRADIGRWGEAQAERLLKRHGYRIVDRRVRIGRRDEIDLVARDGDVLAFVEVKTRGADAFGGPIAAVDRAKRHALSRAAVRYVKGLKCDTPCFRFDVVEIIGTPGAPPRDARLVQNAFPLDRRYRIP